MGKQLDFDFLPIKDRTITFFFSEILFCYRRQIKDSNEIEPSRQITIL
jgi:hypothetical protein